MTPGIHRVDAAIYHADRLRPEITLSSSLARVLIDQSPLHAWTRHPRLNPAYEPDDRKTFDIGRAAHRAVLGAGGDYVAYPDGILASNGAASTKEAKAWAEEQRAAGRTPLKADEVDKIGAMADATRRALAEMGITLDPARSELTALADLDGVWCRAMIDNAPADSRLPLYDFKTCEDASHEAVIRSVTGYGYDVQAAFYLDTWKAATGEDRRFRFVFVEKSDPHEVAVVELYDHALEVRAGKATEGNSESMDADWMMNARGKTAEARRIWRECVDAGQWPGYPRRVAKIGAPSWHSAKWANREIGAPVIQKPSRTAMAAATAWQAP